MFIRFDRIHERDRRTDRHRMTKPRVTNRVRMQWSTCVVGLFRTLTSRGKYSSPIYYIWSRFDAQQVHCKQLQQIAKLLLRQITLLTEYRQDLRIGILC